MYLTSLSMSELVFLLLTSLFVFFACVGAIYYYDVAALFTTSDQNLIFRFLQSKSRIQIWLFEQKDLRIEGRIIGFDEYMNIVLEDAEEISLKKKTRKPLGRILLKGDNITLMMNTGK
ncbi:hypothetical protein O6H91_05G014400 [Diphasiastrum complanatum]|uniref:Uncharacterized protein n=1 Tax=Diphasiastrum complanatum TaxID=34168 RepID=A0ACC2DL74_DIPCM|nr:hypothetical protein O6H91_05G014400 [Diphasiastrum complanatum]